MGRESILRLKVVGTETVKNDLSQIEAAGFRTARNLQRAYEVARQTTPRTPEATAARETVRDIEKQLVGQHAIWKMTDESITAQRRMNLETAKGGAIRKEALLQIAAKKEERGLGVNQVRAEQADADHIRKTALQQIAAAKEERAGGVMVTRAEQEDVKRKLDANKARKQMSLDEAAAYKQNDKIASARAQAIRREGLLVTSAKREENTMQRRLFLDEEAAYAENAKRTTTIAAQKAKAMVAGGISGKEMQTSTLGALLQMGSKRILRQGAGMVAQQIGNTPGIGQEIGLIVGGALYGGPTIAGMAALGGIAAVGAAVAALYRNANEGAKQAAIATQQFTKELSALGKQAAESSTSLDTITKFAERIKTMQEGATQGAVVAGAEKGKAGMRSLADQTLMKVESWFVGGERKTGYGRLRAALTRSGEAQATIAGDLEDELLKQRPIDEQRAETRHQGQINLIAAQSRPSSPQRDRDVFNAEIRLRRDDLAARQEEGLAEAAFGVKYTDALAAQSDKELEIQRKKLKDLVFVDKEAAAAFATATADNLAAHQAAVQAMEHQQGLPATYKRERESEEAKIAADQEKFRRKQEDDDLKKTLDQESAFAVAKNNVQLKGFDREQANLLVNQKQQRVALFFDTTKTAADMKALKATQSQEPAKLDKDLVRTVSDTLDDIRDKRAVTNREMTEEQAQWNQTERSLLRQGGDAHRAEIQDVAAATQAYYQDKHDMELSDIATSQRIRLGMIHGTMDPYEAKREELRRQHKHTPEEIEAIVRGEAKGDSATFIKQERMRKDPYKVYDEYNKSLLQSLGTGEIDKAEYNRRKMDKAQELLGRTDGQFMDAMSYVRNTQTALLGDANIPKETRDGIMAIMRSVAIMVRDGIPWRG